MKVEKQYLKLLGQILRFGSYKSNRTGVATYAFPHYMIQHDMSKGFPLITTKKMGIKSIAAELEFFIKGLKDKQWLKDRNCHIWDEWCNPTLVNHIQNIEERKKQQKFETDLGPIYGSQWRNFNDENYDQLKYVVGKLKNDVNDRRMICSAWNPNQLDIMALPPCHVLWHVTVIDGKINLCWFQRSVDSFLGLPYNLASYALLLKLLALESGLEEGILTGFLSDVHIYENHIDQIKTQLKRKPKKSPKLKITNFDSIYNWQYTDIELTKYESYPSIKAPVAV